MFPAVNLVDIFNRASLSGTTGGLVAGQVILLTDQTTASQNGPWVIAAGAWSRPAWYASGSTQSSGLMAVLSGPSGSSLGSTTWQLNAPNTITVDTSAQTWQCSGPAVVLTTGIPTTIPITPAFIGQLCINVEYGGVWIAKSTTAGDWVAVGGVCFEGGALGVNIDSIGGSKPTLTVISPSGGSGTPFNGGLAFTDQQAFAGSGNGIFWTETLTDGQQVFEIITGPVGTSYYTTVNASGVLQMGAVGTAGLDSMGYGQQATWIPADDGLIAVSFDPTMASSTVTTAPGTLYLSQMQVRLPATITNVIVMVPSTPGTSISGTYVGLFSSAGVLLASSADVSSQFTTTGEKVCALSSPYAASAGTYYVGWMSAASSGHPALSRAASLTANLGRAAANSRYGQGGTGLSTLPSTATVVADNTNAVWMALS